MRNWKIRLSVLCLGCTALILAPVSLTAIGSSPNESAYTDLTSVKSQAERISTTAAGLSVSTAKEAAQVTDKVSQPSASLAPAAPIQPEAAPQPDQHPTSKTPTPERPISVQPTGNPAAPSAESAMEQQIKLWIETLSKENEFGAWAGAAWEIYPLGPGTHSWVVLIRSGKEELGYLVISSTQDGAYKLVEYGSGQNPLFSMNTLYQALVQHGLISNSIRYSEFMKKPPIPLIRKYIPPLQAIWEVKEGDQKRYFDAKTGQELPDIGDWLHKQSPDESKNSTPESLAAKPKSGSITKSAVWDSFDPFIRPTWLKGKPLKAPAFEDWKKAAEAPDARITYSGKWFGGAAVYPLAATGYHQWSSDAAYVRLEHDGSRFVPYADMIKLGGFYPNL